MSLVSRSGELRKIAADLKSGKIVFALGNAYPDYALGKEVAVMVGDLIEFALSEKPAHLPPADADGKRKRLFYWEETEGAWCPAEGLEVEDILTADLFVRDGDTEEIRFKRMDMTDAEFAAIPEG